MFNSLFRTCLAFIAPPWTGRLFENSVPLSGGLHHTSHPYFGWAGLGSLFVQHIPGETGG